MTGAGHDETIVLIEDDPDIAALVRGILADAGHGVAVRSELGSGMADPAVRLVITDLVGIRSYNENAARDWIAKVRQRFPAAAVVVATAHGPAATAGPQALGADAVLAKPFDVDRFGEIVESLLDR